MGMRLVRWIAIVVFAITSVMVDAGASPIPSVAQDCPHTQTAHTHHHTTPVAHQLVGCQCPLSHGAVQPQALCLKGPAVELVVLDWGNDRPGPSRDPDGLMRPPRS